MIDSYKIVISPLGNADLENIYLYILHNLQAPKAANDKINEITSKINSLKNMPSRYPVLSNYKFNKKDIHKTVVDNYIIFYTIDEKNKIVNVSRIIYHRMSYEYLFK